MLNRISQGYISSEFDPYRSERLVYGLVLGLGLGFALGVCRLKVCIQVLGLVTV